VNGASAQAHWQASGLGGSRWPAAAAQAGLQVRLSLKTWRVVVPVSSGQLEVCRRAAVSMTHYGLAGSKKKIYSQSACSARNEETNSSVVGIMNSLGYLFNALGFFLDCCWLYVFLQFTGSCIFLHLLTCEP
jgi:hypothetical protein